MERGRTFGEINMAAKEHPSDCCCLACVLSEQPAYPSQYWKWLSDTGNALGMPGTFNLADVPKEAEEMKADFDAAMKCLRDFMEHRSCPYCYHHPDDKCPVAALFAKHGEKK